MFTGIGIKAIIAAVLVAAVGGAWLYVRHLSAENAKLTANNAVLATTLESEKAAREAIATAREQDARIAAEAIQATAQRAAKVNVIKQEVVRVERVPIGCPEVGPAAALALGRLRDAAAGNQAGSDPAKPAGQPVDVRPGAGRP